MCIDGFVVSNDSADVEAGVRWAYNVSTQEVQTSFSALKESISPYSDTPDDTYCPLTLKFKEQLMSDSIKVYPSFTHGTALPWSTSTSLQTQIQEFATGRKKELRAKLDTRLQLNADSSLLIEADRLLYQAKRQKNCVAYKRI